MKLCIVKTIMNRFKGVVDQWAYRHANRSPKYVDTVLSYIAKLVKKVKSQTKSHFCDPIDPTSIFGFSTMFRRSCDTNNIHEWAAVWALRHYIKETLAIAENSLMFENDRSSPFPFPCVTRREGLTKYYSVIQRW